MISESTAVYCPSAVNAVGCGPSLLRACNFVMLASHNVPVVRLCVVCRIVRLTAELVHAHLALPEMPAHPPVCPVARPPTRPPACHKYARVHACTDACICPCTRAFVHACTHTHVCTHSCTRTRGIQVFQSLSTFSFAFTVHTVLPPIHEEMARPSVANIFKKATNYCNKQYYSSLVSHSQGLGKLAGKILGVCSGSRVQCCIRCFLFLLQRLIC